MGAVLEMKKTLIVALIIALLCSPAYAVKQKRPHTYQKGTGVYQKRKKTYTRNTIPKTTDYKEYKKHQKRPEENNTQTEDFPVPNEYALPNSSAYATVSRAKPKVDIKVERKEVEYVLKDGIFSCSSEKATADGCTHYTSAWDVIVDCGKPSVTLTARETEVEIDLNKQYPKGSCLFDLTLKHELTHLSLNRKVLDTVLKNAAAGILTTFQSMQQRGYSCDEITRTVFEQVERCNAEYSRESDRQNALIDGTDHYKYQREQCFGKD